MKNLLSLGIASLAISGLLASCGGAGNKAVIVGQIDTALHADGKYIYLADESGKHLDSAKVEKNAFRLEHTLVDSIPLGQLILNEQFTAPLYLEAGEVKATFKATDGITITGTPQNDDWAKLTQDVMALDSVYNERYQKATADTLANVQEIQEQLGKEQEAEINKLLEASFKKHPNDKLGARLLVFLLQSEEGKAKSEELLASAGDKVKNDSKVATVLKSVAVQKQTAVGQKFVDVDAKNAQGESVKLSQYVGQGHYALVDFWASWCGPCKHEIPNLISVYNSYKDKGLQVVGLSVWDKLPDHLKAVEELKIPYPQILSFKDENKPAESQTDATDLYGVTGIPEIILFAPDGTILARGLRGEKIKERLEQELKKNGGKL